MKTQEIITHHFVKSEDLNHHGTLFAGRTTEWFVESGLMAAAIYVPPENVVCVKVHGMDFKKPVKLGQTARFVSRIVHAGTTSLIAYTRMNVGESEILCGFITFVNVNSEGKSFPHGLTIEAVSAEDIALQSKAKQLSNTK